MGLDLVEITMELEDTFGIEITEEDLQELDSYYSLTVADLYRIVRCKIEKQVLDAADIRLNLNLWHDMRSLLHEVTDVPEEQIRLGTRLHELFPRNQRTRRWERLRSSGLFQIVPLVLPRSLRLYLGWIFWLSGLVLPIYLAFRITIPHGLWLLIACASAVLLTLWCSFLRTTYEWVLSVFPFLRRSLPDHLVTVKDLCRSVRMGYSTSRSEPRRPPSDRLFEESWSKYVLILSEQLCLPPEEIKPESRLVQDLGMD